MKIVVIGAVAAGSKAAAKIKRENPDAEVVVYSKGRDISYAGCGLPYYVGGDIETREELIVNAPAKFAALTGAEVHTGQEAVGLDARRHCVQIRSTADGTVQEVGYDRLILATGAVPFVPKMEGLDLDGVFTVRTPDDAVNIRTYIEKNGCKKAVVVGAGFIGMEMAENLMGQGLAVTVMDLTSQIMPIVLDPEMADYAQRHLRRQGLKILTNTGVQAIRGQGQVSAVATAAGELRRIW